MILPHVFGNWNMEECSSVQGSYVDGIADPVALENVQGAFVEVQACWHGRNKYWWADLQLIWSMSLWGMACGLAHRQWATMVEDLWVFSHDWHLGFLVGNSWSSSLEDGVCADGAHTLRSSIWSSRRPSWWLWRKPQHGGLKRQRECGGKRAT